MLAKKLLEAAGNSTQPSYIEDVFSTFLYQGNGSTQTITNNIDLSGKGGLVWGKNRDAGWGHYLADTANGVGKFLRSNTTDALNLDSTSLTAFNSTGFSIGNAGAFINNSGVNYSSWTFRKQPKFFDVVTWTGDGTNKTISHNLGSAPGCIIAKRTNSTGSWYVYHRSLSTPNESWMLLQTTGAANTTGGTNIWNVTSTTFQADTYLGLSTSGDTYVAYVFAHNAGGFGLTGTDNVISCGSYTGTGSVGPSVNLGYEPQWLLIKRATGTSAISGWYLLDNMRGIPLSGGSNYLRADTSDAETNNTYAYATPTATGFNVDPGGIGLTGVNFSGETYIYIAIRRGPMKVPTDATSVFTPTFAVSGPPSFTSNSVPDVVIADYKQGGDTNSPSWATRLTGGPFLVSSSTAVENSSYPNIWKFDGQKGFGATFAVSQTIGWMMSRAPSFMDTVCYTSNGGVSAMTLAHNLGVAPEMIIVKKRATTGNWPAYHSAIGATNVIFINATNQSAASSGYWNNTSPTATSFTIGTASDVNENPANTAVAYLFASCPGVSKVGSYTGTGATLTISCGFTGGARFVLIKRTDSASNWYVWDTARGMVAGTDPRLTLNSTVAETNTDWVYTTTGGFQIVTNNTNVNASGGTYIYLAIA